jgi:hypothetical protein
MESHKAKYLKGLRQQLKDQEKWKMEAIALLQKNGVTDATSHKSVVAYQNKINEIREEIEGFDGQSIGFQGFALQEETKSMKTQVAKEAVKTPSTSSKGHDRWADVKQENMMKREWNWVCRMDSYLPSYMRDNLKRMANNKGYIWKGIHYYGDRPPEHPRDITTMFEKQNHVQIIHEYGPTFYRIFEKADKNKPKVLIYEKIKNIG